MKRLLFTPLPQEVSGVSLGRNVQRQRKAPRPGSHGGKAVVMGFTQPDNPLQKRRQRHSPKRLRRGKMCLPKTASIISWCFMFFTSPVWAAGIRVHHPESEKYSSLPAGESAVHMAAISYTSPAVSRSTGDGSRIPNDPDFSMQDYLLRTNAARAWNLQTDASGITIAVIDSGVDIDHPDLAENIWINTDEIPANSIDDDKNGYVDDVQGWDFVEQVPDPRPKLNKPYASLGINHGTIVAGVLAARGDNGIGITGTVWKAKIMPLRVLNGMGEGITDNVAKAIEYAVKNGARIINLSFVGHDSSLTMTQAVQDAWKAGVLVVAAAGNEVRDGINLDIKPAYPVCQDGPKDENWVFGVTSIDHADRLASFSNYGSRCIDVSAPGVSVYSTMFWQPENGFDRAYSGWWSGTSVAAPQVSALAALIWSLNSDLTLRQVQDLIKENAIDIDNKNPTIGGHIGSGKIDMAASMAAAQTTLPQRQQFPRPPATASTAYIITAPRGGISPEIRVYDHKTNLISSFYAFNKDSKVGVQAAAGDLDGDGELEIITAAAKGGTPQINVYSLHGVLKSTFLAYAYHFTGGVRVTVGDMDGDGIKEIITGPGPGGGPHVRVFDYYGKPKGQFFAYHEKTRHGIEVTSGDIDGDGTDEIITAPGPGAEPRVRIFTGKGGLRRELLVFPETFTGGIHIASADLDGNHAHELLVSAGKNGGPQVRIINYNGEVLNQFFAYPQTFKGGVIVGSGDVNDDGRDEIITAPESGGGPHVRVFTPQTELLTQFFAFSKEYRAGVNITSGY